MSISPSSPGTTFSAIGMVLQDTWLFKGTIRENILYGNPNASEANRIIVMEAGQIVEHGTHERLLEEGGTYCCLYNAQFASSE